MIPKNAFDSEYIVLDPQRYLRLFRRKFGSIMAVTLLAAGLAGLVAFFGLKPVYEAQTTLLVIHNQTDQPKENAAANNLEDLIANITKLPELTIKSYLEQIKNPLLLKKLSAKLGLNPQEYPLKRLQRMIIVTAIKDTNLIQIRVDHTDPKLAVTIAQTITKLLLDSVSENSKQQMAKSLAFLNSQLQDVEAELTSLQRQNPEPDGVKRRITRLEQTANLMIEKMIQTQITESVSYGDTSLQEIYPPALLDEPVRPHKNLLMAGAGLIGFFSALLLIGVGERNHPRAYSKTDIESFAELTVVGEIPHFKPVRNGQLRRWRHA